LLQYHNFDGIKFPYRIGKKCENLEYRNARMLVGKGGVLFVLWLPIYNFCQRILGVGGVN